MSTFTRCAVSTNIVSQLSDTPNVTEGLSGDDLKAKFDKAGTDLKTYLNDTLIAELEGTGCAAKLGIASITGMLATTVQAALAEIYAAATAGLGAGEVKTANIDDGAVTTVKVADSAITYAKTSGVQKAHSKTTVTIPAISAGGSQTVSVTGVTATNDVIWSPKEDEFLKWRDCGVRCTEQGSGTLKFEAESATGETLTANILIFD